MLSWLFAIKLNCSLFVVQAKTDMVLVMLKKAEEKNWAYITETDKKSKEKKP